MCKSLISLEMRAKICRINLSLAILLISCVLGGTQLEEDDPCGTVHYKGICAVSSNCSHLSSSMDAMGLNSKDVARCGYNVREEIICCPNVIPTSAPTTMKPPEFTTMSSKSIREMLAALPANERKQKLKDLIKEAGIGGSSRPTANPAARLRISGRPAEVACKAIEKQLMPISIMHILGGEAVVPAEYPHMAKLVYDQEDLNCGGTLIHKHFVLTAAHCIESRQGKLLKVILGVTNFNDPEQYRSRVEINVKETYVHPNYSSFFHYFDIGLIELERDAEFSVNVYPTCLQTELTELPDNTELVVTGWGRTENTTASGPLMAAKLNLVSVPQCNLSYKDKMDRHLSHGIDNTQLCAFTSGRDACWGDSGGPLHFVKDKAFGNYRVVGIVSFGFLCGRNLPGVYTNVVEFLDFIESIVWPDG